MEATLDARTLKERHRQVRDAQPEGLRMRIHRAISWLARAEQEADDQDARFVFLWIALNAAYANEFGFEQSERDQTRAFIDKVLACDQAGRLRDAVFCQYTGPIRALIENKFVFEPFWRALRCHDSSDAWEQQFAAG
ncbi:HEPN domain-containing protein [Stenotrophomonas maltophilia]|uniref:HEPN domain-containing protein n=1 Tax=Stenotrophomonas maltophilia TaxID=40324 RepID=UPI001EFBCE34|nr:HEPN domain-containing protein [Stenotrophomonas maltophilia]